MPNPMNNSAPAAGWSNQVAQQWGSQSNQARIAANRAKYANIAKGMSGTEASQIANQQMTAGGAAPSAGLSLGGAFPLGMGDAIGQGVDADSVGGNNPILDPNWNQPGFPGTPGPGGYAPPIGLAGLNLSTGPMQSQHQRPGGGRMAGSMAGATQQGSMSPQLQAAMMGGQMPQGASFTGNAQQMQKPGQPMPMDAQGQRDMAINRMSSNGMPQQFSDNRQYQSPLRGGGNLPPGAIARGAPQLSGGMNQPLPFQKPDGTQPFQSQHQRGGGRVPPGAQARGLTTGGAQEGQGVPGQHNIPPELAGMSQQEIQNLSQWQQSQGQQPQGNQPGGGIDPSLQGLEGMSQQQIQQLSQQTQGQQSDQYFANMAPELAGDRTLQDLQQIYGYGEQSALNALGEGTEQGVGALDPFAQTGQSSQALAAALAGGPGAEAAYANYSESPDQKYLREQGRREILQNATATGGTQGANVLQELQKHRIGLASQNINDRINQNTALGAQGLSAAGQQANLYGTQGQVGANIYGTAAQALGGARENIGSQQVANRFQTGRDMATSRATQANLLSQLANQQGMGMSNLTGQQGATLAQLLQGSGAQDSQAIQEYMNTLANISTGSASQMGSMPGIPGTQGGGGPSDATQMAQSAAQMYMMYLAAGSDSRLKENVRYIGKKDGHNVYEWDWNQEGERLFGDQPTYGVIAQEAAKIAPEAVSRGKDGYLRVNYGEL